MIKRVNTYNLYRARGVFYRLLFAFSLATIAGCINKFDDASTQAESLDFEYNLSIKRLHEVLPSTISYYDFKDDLVICGNVTATDESSNFYRSFIIEQSGYGVEILEGLRYSYVRHNVGAKMVISLNGLRASRYRGVLQIGMASSTGSSYDLDYLQYELIVDQHITNTGLTEVVTPRKTTLSELESQTLVNELAGALVSISGLTLVQDEEEMTTTLWSGTISFADSEGRTLNCYTNSYADFAACEVPTDELTLVGILQSDDGVGEIKIRSVKDCIVSE